MLLFTLLIKNCVGITILSHILISYGYVVDPAYTSILIILSLLSLCIYVKKNSITIIDIFAMVALNAIMIKSIL